MNNLCKIPLRFATIFTNSSRYALKNVVGKRDFTRNLWHMAQRSENCLINSKFLTEHKPSLGCTCGCNKRFVNTQAERALVEFLTEEVAAEKNANANKCVPAAVNGFLVSLDSADVELTKKCGKEKVVVSFNVNHTVDTEEPECPGAEMGPMRSKPRFEVDIIKGDCTLSFTCSYLSGTPADGECNDLFAIDEFSIFQGQWNDKVYSVAGDVLDGCLYDLLMNLLEEKGVGSEFVERLSDFATVYEQSLYISLLEKLSKFICCSQ